MICLKKLNSNKGVALPLAIGFAIVIIGIATLLFHRAQQNVNVFQFYTAKEKNYYLSQAGQNYTKSIVNQAIKDLNINQENINDNTIIEDLKDWIKKQFKKNVKSQSYAIDISPLKTFLEKNETLEIELIISDWKSNSIKSPYSISRNIFSEFQAKLKIVSKAITHKKKRDETIETVSYTHLKKTNIIPSILSKFVLYIKNQNGNNFNEIQDSGSFGKVSHTPIMIYSGEEKIKKRSSPLTIRKQIEKSGWIYLGQNDWEIYASQMGNKKQFQDSFLGGINFRKIPEGTVLDLPEAKYISMIKGFYKEAKIEKINQVGPLPYNVLTMEENYPSVYSSDFNLFGNPKKTSVTFIFGSVTRKIIQLNGVFLANVGKILYLPYLTEDDFNEEEWPVSKTPPKAHYFSNTFKNQLAEEGHQNIYEAYKKIMTKVVSEPINKAILAGLKINKSYPFSYKTNRIPKLTNLISKKQNLDYYKEANDSNAYTILNENGEVLVDEIKLQNININYLQSKVSKTFNSQNSFFNNTKLKNGDLNISGVLLVKGDLTFQDKVHIKKFNGGIILVTGNILIKKNIYCDNDELLTLISLNGSIKVGNNLKIQAGLIALDGSIHLPMAFDIYGLVAAGDLNLIKPTNRSYKRVISYNKSYDPTNSLTYDKQYRMSYEQNWSHYVH
ncbi:MAG: hypothetical protein COB02_13375 [Candidatus Cloacimonadota bacterium]|nr:MAG: hypothetical protein COB02_13375 [Candidatus Cloacimonadota bacterium]